MDIKYIITQIKDDIICSQYIDDDCRTLNIIDDSSLTGNIYIGRVENVVKNINSAFIEIENKLKCYYPLDENKKHIFLNTKNNNKVNIGDKLLVQVINDAHKTKPPTVSCKIELSGKYIVLSSDVNGISISRKIKSSIDRKSVNEALKDKLTASLNELNKVLDGYCSFNYGIILRSNSSNADINAVIKEADELMSNYNTLIRNAFFGTFYTKLHEKEPDYIKEISHLGADNNITVITDVKNCYTRLNEYFSDIPSVTIRWYEDSLLPLYKLYSIEKHLTDALSLKVWLKCGGYLIIEQTEAMCVIDVNSGKNISKSKKQADKEQEALKVNLEACEQIIKQVRLRNISGIIIIDFINLSEDESVQKLMTHMKSLAKKEPVQTNIVDMTPLGLVEMTRKNNGKTLKELIKDRR